VKSLNKHLLEFLFYSYQTWVFVNKRIANIYLQYFLNHLVFIDSGLLILGYRKEATGRIPDRASCVHSDV